MSRTPQERLVDIQESAARAQRAVDAMERARASGPSMSRSGTSKRPPGACSNFRLTPSRPPSPTRERRVPGHGMAAASASPAAAAFAVTHCT